MQKNWYRLSLDISLALTPQFREYALNAACTQLNFGTIDRFEPEEVFDAQWLAQVQQSWNLSFYRVLLFVRENDQDPGAHVDHGQYSSAVNWCLGEDRRQMLWYQLNPGVSRISPWFRYDQVTQIDQCRIGSGPVLVRTDIPHSISGGEDRRVCVSARLDPPQQSWADTVARLRGLLYD